MLLLLCTNPVRKLMMTTAESIIIAVVEGITEFLPISSTGHMIITQELLGVQADNFTKAFIVNIQFGAILSVLVLYWKRFLQSFDFYLKLAVACLPLILAFFLEKLIDQMLESVLIVALSLLLGGIVLLFVDRWFKYADRDIEKITYRNAFIIGLIQIVSVIPGVSRSAATIIGGMSQNLNRKSAAEFSFFLAVPTMLLASGYKLIKNYEILDSSHISTLLIGNLTAFIVAMIAIKGFISFLTRHGFRFFGWYRIALGSLLLILLAIGVDLNLV